MTAVVCRCFLLAVAACILGACADNSTVFRKFDVNDKLIDGPTSVSIDANQRTVLVKRREDGVLIVCAEPSPDAISTYNSTVAAKLAASDRLTADFSGVFTQAAEALGQRTATIQLLRDGLYRACEAHMNGALDGVQYAIITERYVNLMVALFAIERITDHRGVSPGVAGPQAGASEDPVSVSAGNQTLESDRSLVERIVHMVVEQNSIPTSCLNFLISPPSSPARQRDAFRETVRSFCLEFLAARIPKADRGRIFGPGSDLSADQFPDGRIGELPSELDSAPERVVDLPANGVALPTVVTGPTSEDPHPASWFRIINITPAEYRVEARSSVLDTVLYVYARREGGQGLTVLAKNDDASEVTFDSRLRIRLEADVEYFVAVHAWDFGEVGGLEVQVSPVNQ